MLFNIGNYKLSSGRESKLKIDCDFLTDEDWEALAQIAVHLLPLFSRVEGVPTGGLKFAKALEKYTCSKLCGADGKLLICDDVLTTGGSMIKQRAGREAIGIVVFARGICPSWVTPILPLNENLYGI